MSAFLPARRSVSITSLSSLSFTVGYYMVWVG